MFWVMAATAVISFGIAYYVHLSYKVNWMVNREIDAYNATDATKAEKDEFRRTQVMIAKREERLMFLSIGVGLVLYGIAFWLASRITY